MNRSKLFSAISALLLLFSCNTVNKNYIVGDVKGLVPGNFVALTITNPITKEYILLDSVTLVDSAKFSLSTTETDQYCILFFFQTKEQFELSNTVLDAIGNRPKSLFLEGFDTINVTGSGSFDATFIQNGSWWKGVTFDGGLLSMDEYSELLKYDKILDSIEYIVDDLIAYERTAPHFMEKFNEQMKERSKYFKIRDSLSMEFVKQNPDFAFSARILRFYSGYSSIEEVMKLKGQYDSLLSDRVKLTPIGIEIKELIDHNLASSVGHVLKDFCLKSNVGEEHSLYDFRGRYIFLDFWGSWCGPCMKSIPNILKFHDMIDTDSIVMIGVAVSEHDGGKAWRRTIEEKNLPGLQLIDSIQESGMGVADNYAINAVPTALFIDPNGVVIYRDHPVDVIDSIKNNYTELLK